jgi:hypothetical protein
VGRYREAARELTSLNDSGYGSPSVKAKRQRLETDLSCARLPLIEEIESGYSAVYLSRDNSLERSHRQGVEPPIMDDPRRVVQALNLSPNFTGGLRDQIDRMSLFRQFPNAPAIIDLTQEP